MTATDHAPTHADAASSATVLTLGQFTDLRWIVPRLLNTGEDGVIHELAKRLEAGGRIPDAAAFTAAVIKRERDLPTYAGYGVVAPHGRGAAVRALSLAVGLSADGVPWGRGGRLRAHAVFLFAIPLTAAATYLALLSGLAALVQDEEAFAFLKAARQPEDILRVLHSVRWTAGARADQGAPRHSHLPAGQKL